MIKVYYAGREPNNHANYTKFAVGSCEYSPATFERDSISFLNSNPALFEIAIEINGRRFQLAAGMMPIEIKG